MLSLDAQIESILFFKSEPVHVSFLVETLNVSEEKVREALEVLETNLQDRGLRLMRKDDAALLATTPEMGELFEHLIKEELQKDLGKAGLETLTIILYYGPVPRSRIDYIRGVNSTYMLRHLLVRGLIEKIPNPQDSRSYLYRPSFDLLSYLGITTVEELPEYEAVREELRTFETSTED